MGEEIGCREVGEREGLEAPKPQQEEKVDSADYAAEEDESRYTADRVDGREERRG
jgi:hypothetical protein